MEYGLIGEKLGHSFSKVIHNALCNYDYQLMELAPLELEGFMKRADFKAINVTMPYKEKILPFLDYIDPQAEEIGAVNTVVNQNGRLFGYNTDFLGLKALILKNGISLKDKKVLILGSGGTSKTACAVARDLNAAEIFRVSRSGGEGLITYEEAVFHHSDTDVIINTTPCGMYPDIGKAPIDIDDFKSLTAVVDVIYNPLASELVIKARQKGIKAIGGFYMLVAQAFYAAEKFVGRQLKLSDMERIYNRLLVDRKNLVLIGMPGCGKSTIGRELAAELGKKFVDSDELIVNRTNKTIPEIFAECGEVGFRKIESEVIAELSSDGSSVIATGGGAILNSRNVELLKENGTIIFIDRPLRYLVTTSDRPLSQDREMLEKRYNERYSLYCEAADIKVSVSQDLKENITRIKEAFFK